MSDKQPGLPGGPGAKGVSMDRPAHRSGVQVSERNGIWEVKVDGRFHGDYLRKEHALAAAASVRLSTR